jgi:hypothetical protein
MLINPRPRSLCTLSVATLDGYCFGNLLEIALVREFYGDSMLLRKLGTKAGRTTPDPELQLATMQIMRYLPDIKEKFGEMMQGLGQLVASYGQLPPDQLQAFAANATKRTARARCRARRR